MKLRLKSLLLAAIAIACGLVVLLGYFLDIPMLIGLRVILLRWATVLMGVAWLVGVMNLARSHWTKVRTHQAGGVYSLFLLLSLLLTIVIVGYFGPTNKWSLLIFNSIQVPIETSLMALLSVVLVYAAIKLLKRRPNAFSMIFVGTAVVVLLGSLSLPLLEYSGLPELRTWISQVLAMAGGRGILLGVALGTMATGLRVLVGMDRPFGG